MRLHTDTLTSADLHEATRELSGVFVEGMRRHGSRSRSYAFDFRLAHDGSDGRRRRRNTGSYGAEDGGYPAELYAADWDEHGFWMAELFRRDPAAKIGPYDGAEDFHAQTNGSYTRLEWIRREIRAERVSYGELAELQGMADEIASDDVELLEWAGVSEHV